MYSSINFLYTPHIRPTRDGREFEMKALKLICLVLFVVCCIGNPVRAHAQWTGPSYSYDGNYPNYIVTNVVHGTGSSEYTNSPKPMVHAWTSGASGDGTVEIKFKAEYSAAPGTAAKTVHCKADFTGSYTVTGTGTGYADCMGVATPDGQVTKDTTNSGNPISPVTWALGNRLISAPHATIPLQGYAHVDSDPHASGTASANAKTELYVTD